ncbi:AAA family ATPase [Thiothrix litoralis]|uniref:AAA family ATPase n=1 Tax=Thiothrix litoralis TaxID=2891210 RepID=A0ABX7WSD6_9GAMM|nr:AAA family ATPase [Thiothrix litoralis]QTR46609.1 AAA family ATPase [Thiothrix litoralis]
MLQLDKTHIQARKAELEAAKQALKQHFVGIDKIIDELMDCIQVWYLMPELLKRPVIINLWGMTGVGKTDLVRQLVKHLHFQDRFAEIELSNTGQTSWSSSVSAVLDDYGFHNGKPCIVLFDEIQRFNTIDSKGEALPQTKFMDFWELLSDGHLSKKQKDDLDSFLYEYYQRERNAQRRRSKGDKDDEEDVGPAYISTWDAINLKKALNLDMDVGDMLDITEEEMVNMILAAKRKKVIYEPINHTQTLILISGNLDDAFQMAHQAAEADVDADIFHAFTTKVTLMDIKDALLRKFRPEQVARFGNIHLVYPSLRKQDFNTLITREVNRVQTDTEQRTGIRLVTDASINRLIYRNGVFPVQGVRPLFSSVTDILEVNLSRLLLQALTDDADEIHLHYDEAQQKIMARLGDATLEYPYVGRIDKIRQDNTLAAVANISAHEAGHAVVYMVLFGLIPLQLQSKVASSYASGFTFPHQLHRTRRSLLDMIKVYLAGGVAEELLFGYQEASTGRENDRERATELAMDYVRRYGFDDEFQATYTIEDYPHRMNTTVTDMDVEKMMMRLVSETKELLGQYAHFLHALSNALADAGKLETQDVAAIAQQHEVQAEIKPEGHLHIADYDVQLRKPLVWRGRSS